MVRTAVHVYFRFRYFVKVLVTPNIPNPIKFASHILIDYPFVN